MMRKSLRSQIKNKIKKDKKEEAKQTASEQELIKEEETPVIPKKANPYIATEEAETPVK